MSPRLLDLLHQCFNSVERRDLKGVVDLHRELCANDRIEHRGEAARSLAFLLIRVVGVASHHRDGHVDGDSIEREFYHDLAVIDLLHLLCVADRVRVLEGHATARCLLAADLLLRFFPVLDVPDVTDLIRRLEQDAVIRRAGRRRRGRQRRQNRNNKQTRASYHGIDSCGWTAQNITKVDRVRP